MLGSQYSDSRGTCYVHIGTHKTGSTTLQDFLQRHTDQLAVRGIHIPLSGRLAGTADGSGHHCVAWDLLGSDAVSPISGTTERLIAEIQARSLPTVCLSSEEFVHLYLAPNKMQRLRAGLAGIGYRVILIVYLRPQADYLEALYAEVSRHAPVRDFWECYREVLAHGAADLWPKSFTTMFDYERLITAFIPIVGRRNIIVRPFRRYREPYHLVDDFMRTVGLPDFRLGSAGSVTPAHINPGVRFGDVVRAIRINRSDLLLGVPDQTRSLADEGPFDPLRPHEIARIAMRFGFSNARLALRHRAFVGCVSATGLARAIRALCVTRNSKSERFHRLRALFVSPNSAALPSVARGPLNAKSA